jgi:hypothetical protein
MPLDAPVTRAVFPSSRNRSIAFMAGLSAVLRVTVTPEEG